MKALCSTFAVLCLLALPVFAHAYGPEVGALYGRQQWDKPQGRWNHRNPVQQYNNLSPYRGGMAKRFTNPIAQGINSGRLSQKEARELQRKAFEIHRKERMYLFDGHYSWRERADLKAERHDFYKDLKHELNDGERRW
jgi:hypothetical protein